MLSGVRSTWPSRTPSGKGLYACLLFSKHSEQRKVESVVSSGLCCNKLKKVAGRRLDA